MSTESSKHTNARCTIYARSACVEQSAAKANPAIEEQVRICRALAQKWRWEVSDNLIFADGPASGNTACRPALSALLQSAESGAFDRVLVAEMTRLGRSLVVVWEILEALNVFGIDVHCSSLSAISLSELLLTSSLGNGSVRTKSLRQEK